MHATEVQYYSQYNATVQTTTSTSVSVGNNSNAGGSVIFYVRPLTNDLTNYDTPASFTSVTGYGQSPDTTPSSFSFTSPTSTVALNSSNNTSNIVTLAGMDDGFSTSVSVSGGTLYYSTQSSSGFSSITSSANISTSNKYIYVAATASNNYTTTTQVSVNYGGATASYTVTTIPATPSNDISFTSVTTQVRDTYFESAELILTGFGDNSGNIPVYSSENTTKFIAGSSSGGTTFITRTSAAPYYATSSSDGKLYLKLSVKSSANYSTGVTGTVYVGTKNGTFTVTTGAAPILAPTSVTVAFSNQTQTTATVTVSASGGNAVDSYNIKNYTSSSYTTEASPQFTFTKSGATFSVTGLTQNSSYYVKGFATNAGGTTSSTGTTLSTIANDTTPDSVSLTLNSGYPTSPSPGTLIKASGTVAGLTAEIPVTISWSSSGFTGAALRSTSPVVITGIPTTYIISTSSTGTISFEFSATTSNTYSASNTLSFTVGTVTNNSAFSISNRAVDTTPNAFSFADSTGLDVGGLASTSTQFIYGMDNRVQVPVSIADGTLYYLPVDSGTMVQYSGSGTLETDNFGNLTIAITASAPYAYATTKTVTLTVGGVNGTWKVTTKNVAPGAPSGVTGTPSDSTTVSISWTAPSTGGTPVTYSVKLYSGSTNVETRTANYPATSQSISGLTASATYTAQVSATNSIGTSASATSPAFTMPDAPFTSPTPFTGTSTSATQVLTFSYTATHTRTYTVTATGYDCKLSLNNSAYQDSDNAPGFGESKTISLTKNATLTIKVTGATAGANTKFGTITVTIT